MSPLETQLLLSPIYGASAIAGALLARRRRRRQRWHGSGEDLSHELQRTLLHRRLDS